MGSETPASGSMDCAIHLQTFFPSMAQQSIAAPSRKPAEYVLAPYEKLGFVVEGRRKGYYEDNGEDALIMWYRAKGEEKHNDN